MGRHKQKHHAVKHEAESKQNVSSFTERSHKLKRNPVKYQTTIPKAVREKLGISINDTLEWIVKKGKVVVSPMHNNFLRYRGSVKVGAGDIAADIQAAREGRMEKYR